MRKNNYIIALIILFVHTVYFGQSQNMFENKIDSIQKLIMSNQDENREKVILLNELARNYFYNLEMKKGLLSTKKAINMADEIGYEGGRLLYYLTLSTSQGVHGNDAIQVYYQKKAEWLSKSFGNQSRNDFTDIEIPDIILGDDIAQRRERYLKILPFLEDEHDKEIRANNLLSINTMNFVLGELDKVLAYFDIIDSIYQDLNQVYPKFLNLTYRLLVYNNLDRKEDYKNTELELLKLFLNSKDENTIGLIASTIASNYAGNGRYLLSIEYYLKSIEEFEKSGDLETLSVLHHDIGVAYENIGMNSKAVDSYKKAIDDLRKINNKSNLFVVYGTIMFPLIAMENYDEALKYMALVEQDSLLDISIFRRARLWDAKGQMLMNQEKYELAIPYFIKAKETFIDINTNNWAVPFMDLYIAECYLKTGHLNKALSHAMLCLNNEASISRVLRKANLLASNIYEKMGDESLALKHLKTYQEIVEEANKLDEINRIADAEVKSILEKSQIEIVELEREQETINQQNKLQRLWLMSIAGALLSAMLVLYILFRNNRSKQKTNALLIKQKEKVELTLKKLKDTQKQLIQTEKMASLGELTAGIAHEIQNPLNFVNNFSEVNTELISELNEEIEKGDIEEAKAIASDIAGNEKKITHHGKRADAIVKGMLQHSRVSSNVKEVININMLADEYLRLSYHGLRAKDKSFNADFKTNFDETLPKVNVIPQDIGRVLLNLINNAFHAVAERSRNGDSAYKPLVLIETKREKEYAIITVKDNGNGIPEKIRDKIFQPFFTTKPTGEGTGLGLSLSYDIITKGHGGELKLETNDGEGSEFIIHLPA